MGGEILPRFTHPPDGKSFKSGILLETFVANLVFLTCPSLQILGKAQTGVFPISGFVITCHNSRTSDHIYMNLRPVTKLDKRNKTTSEKLTIISFWKIVTSLLFFRFTANLEQSGRVISDLKLIFSSNFLSYKNWK